MKLAHLIFEPFPYGNGLPCIITLFLFICIALSGTTTTIHAAEGNVTVNISTYLLNDGRTTELWAGDGLNEGKRGIDLYFFSNGRPQSIPLQYEMTSGPSRYIGPPRLTFYNTPLTEIGDQLPPTAAELTLPTDVSDVLLVFITESFNDERFRVFALDTSLGRVGRNELRFINLLGLPVAWQLEDNRGHLEPHQSGVATFDSDTTRNRLRLAFWDVEQENWRVSYNRLLRLYPNQRYDVLLTPPIGGGRPMVHIVSDYLNARQSTSDALVDPLLDPDELNEEPD